jgi:hypothetical protein
MPMADATAIAVSVCALRTPRAALAQRVPLLLSVWAGDTAREARTPRNFLFGKDKFAETQK